MAALDPRQWSEVERLFTAALELPRDRRDEFLRQACADPDVRSEAASLLDHAGGGLSSISEAIAAATADLAGGVDPDARLIGARLGPYRVDAIAGHGGMGAVYRATRDDAEFRQQVAIKLVRAAAESPATLRRFKQERQILARLAHPHIARLLDGGSTPEGVPYLVMEFIEGEPITTWCERRALPIADRLRLFLHVCEAVAFAHRERVVHRDLKPANILVTRDSSPKLLDFGIAKLLDPDPHSEAISLTTLHVMTPDYAAPEQVRGEAASVTTDIYALGLVLYEMLTGRKAQEIPHYTPVAISQVVCHLEPKAPAALKPQLSGDLDNIVRMAIRKEPQRRYASVSEMARDIQRHLEGRTVTARPDTLGYRTAKFLRRNRAAAAVGAGAAAVIAIAAALTSLAGGFARAPRVSRVLQITQIGRVELGNNIATDGSRIFFTERSGGRWSLAQVSVEGGPPQTLPQTLPFPEIQDISPDHTQLLVLAGLEDSKPLYLLPTAGGPAHRVGGVSGFSAAWSRDGRSIIFFNGSALFRVNIDGSDCRKLLHIPDPAFAIRSSPGTGPDVLRFSLWTNDLKRRVLWEVHADGANLHPIRLHGWNSNLVYPDTDDRGIWTPGGNYYLFRTQRGPVFSFWAVRESHGLSGFFSHKPMQIYSTPLELGFLAPARDGRRVFFTAGLERRELARYDDARHQFAPFLPGVAGRAVDFSRDGRWLLYTTFQGDTLWRCRADGSECRQLTPTDLRARWPQWSPDGARIVFAAATPRVYVVPAAGGPAESVTPEGYWDEYPSWSPDGHSLAVRRSPLGRLSAGHICLLNLVTHQIDVLPGPPSFTRPSWSPDGRYIAADHSGDEVLLFDLKTRAWSSLTHGTGFSTVRWSRDSRHAYVQDAFGGTEQPIFRVRISDGKAEKVAGFSQIPQSDLTGFVLAGIDPAGAPIISVIHRNSDIYALDMDWP